MLLGAVLPHAFCAVTSRGCHNFTHPPFPLADPTLGLEAQQKYSTGYIQCMHEVHNLLLTCDWMDKTLGSRLLNHLLKSLPRSTDERHLQPIPRQDVPPPASQGTGLPDTPLRAEPLTGRQHLREGPTCHVAGRRERPALHSSQLGMLEMWRPWWTGGLMSLVVYFVRPSSVMYLIDMLLRRQTWGSFVPVIIIVGVLWFYTDLFSVLPFRSRLLVACIIEGSY